MQAPTQYEAAVDVDYRGQIYESLLRRNICDANAPNLVPVVNFKPSQQIWLNILCHAKVLSERPCIRPGCPTSAFNTPQRTFFDTLPESFDRQAYQRLTAALGIPSPNADRHIKKWVETVKIEYVDTTLLILNSIRFPHSLWVKLNMNNSSPLSSESRGEWIHQAP